MKSNMLIGSKLNVEAPFQKVRDFMLDSQKFWSSVRCCEKTEILGENAYRSLVGAKVGPRICKIRFCHRIDSG